MADHIVGPTKSRSQEGAPATGQSGIVSYFVVDDVLPHEVCNATRIARPKGKSMRGTDEPVRPILEEALYAFQDPRVIALVQDITGLTALEPDDPLYAGGISMIAKGHFLNSHIDNSHTRSASGIACSICSSLFYVSPEWSLADGGNLELWPDDPKA